jgi:hypothetical protein
MRHSEFTKRPVSISESLTRRLSVYAAAAGAAGVSLAALATPAAGEVVYTGAHQQVNRDQGYAIDLNHDGLPDFVIQNMFKNLGSSYFSWQIGIRPSPGGEVIYKFHPYMAAGLLKGAVIGARGPFQPEQFIDMAVVFRLHSEGGTYSFGYWLDEQNLYAGLRFKINGEEHYGWARMTVAFNAKYNGFARLTGYAYETEPNTPITAGDTGKSGRDDASELLIMVEPLREPGLGALALGAAGKR